MDEILRQQIAQPANSCCSENGVSFLDKVITPLYDVVAAVCHNLVAATSYLFYEIANSVTVSPKFLDWNVF